MTRLLIWSWTALAALIVASILVTALSPDQSDRERARLQLQVDSLRSDIEEGRSAFNKLAQRFTDVEQRCVFPRARRTPAKSRSAR